MNLARMGELFRSMGCRSCSERASGPDCTGLEVLGNGIGEFNRRTSTTSLTERGIAHTADNKPMPKVTR